MIWNFIILPLSRRLVSFTSGSQLPSQRLQQGRLKAGCCLGKSTTSVTRIRNRRGAVMRFALSRFSPPLPRRIPLVKSVLSWSSWSPLRVIIFSLIGGSQWLHLRSVSKSNGDRWHWQLHRITALSSKSWFVFPWILPHGGGGRRIGSFRGETNEMSHRSEFIVPDLIENLPLENRNF